MDKGLIKLPQMLLIGSTGRNSGKTTLAVELIKQWKNVYPIIALKITTIEEKHGGCPRGGAGCGVCSNVKGNFEIVQEHNNNNCKDTCFLLDAGAKEVYWIKTLRTHIYQAIEEFISTTSKNSIIICESNSLRNVVNPGCFIMMHNVENSNIKKSASEVMSKVDYTIDFDVKDNINFIRDKILVKKDNTGLFINISKGGLEGN